MQTFNHIIVIENERHTHESIMSLIGNNSRAFYFLTENNYLTFKSHNSISFNFVGAIVIEDVIICSLPKYYRNHSLDFSDLFTDFITIIKVLKKVGHVELIPDSKNISSDETINSSELVLADRFIKDYLEYGIFQKSSNFLFVNGQGEVSWNDTISLLDPVFIKGRPVYADIYSLDVLSDQTNLITEFHKWVIKYCLNKYGLILDYEFPFFDNSTIDFSEINSLENLYKTILNELSITFLDREIILLKRMLFFIKKKMEDGQNTFEIFGSCYFHVIWEKTCSSFFSNRREHFTSLIPSPIWHDLENNTTAKDSLIPDIIAVVEEPVSSKLFIFDAKYYNIFYDQTSNFKVTGNPGVIDVGKQFMYEKIFAGLPFSSKYNCFLFPKLNDSSFKIFGFVSFQLFPVSFIYNIYLDPKNVFDLFIANKACDKSILLDLAQTIDMLETEKR